MRNDSVQRMAAGKPIFIGNFRSGTTLLVNLLGLHPSIAPWFETKALCEPLRWLRVLNHPESTDLESSLIRLPGPAGFSVEAVADRMLSDFRVTAARMVGAEPSGKAGEERYPIGYDHVIYDLAFAEQAVCDWVNDVGTLPDSSRIARATGKLINALGRRQADLAGKPLWINKTPEIARFGRELRLCLGSVGILLMIRDGRDVVRSATRLGWGSAEDIGLWWQGMIEQSRLASVDVPGGYMELRYEDLLGDPEVTMGRVLAFLGLPDTGTELVARYRENFPLKPMSSTMRSDTPVPHWLDADFMKSLGYR